MKKDFYKVLGVAENAPAEEVIQKIKLYMDSVGRFGDSPFIYPVYGLAGVVQPAKKKDIFTGTDELVRLTTPEEAKAHPAEWLAKVAAHLAGKIG